MLPGAIQHLADLIAHWPGIGQRAASRLAVWLNNQPDENLENLAIAIKNLKSQTRRCSNCFVLTTGDSCPFCTDTRRDQTLICAVEDILDIIPIERTKAYAGTYHVLDGLIAPHNGLTPEKLRIAELISRVKKNNPAIKEIILALNPTTEGDTTAFYLERILKPLGVKITRLGRGLSTGSDLEYTDEATLSNALQGRK